ncbi:MAG: hypothetical protein D6798_06365 [Deltaproteobacteria bacterium]|nr:MAG: hypothetical protein D6798_06365 [Deltaproteobacteria bacterium]
MNPIRGPAPWAALLLSVAHLVLAVVQRPAAETVVLTPFIPVEPDGAEGPPLSAEEGAVLAARPGAADARDIARGYATLGSTLSLAELLAGVEALSGPQALDRRQQREIGAILAAARDQHEELIDVQRQILDLEAAIQARVRRIQALRGGSPRPQRSAPPPGGRDEPR